jgi:(2R)-sulfolactate sulfo-lyase subunit alpha
MGADDSEPVACLVHHEGDDVAVTVRDVEPGEITVAWLDSGRRGRLAVQQAIPLGHKVALHALAEGQPVTEYGEEVAITRSAIAPGTHVHTHNVRSARWQRSA